jgi:hypothetical protein
MTDGSLRRLHPGAPVRQVNLAARVAVLPSPMERGNAERERLYKSARWWKERAEFLRLHPACTIAGCGKASCVVDHRDGHQDPDWLARFWDRSRWDALCLTCHAVKSRAELQAWRQAGEATRGGGSASWGAAGGQTAMGLRNRARRDI